MKPIKIMNKDILKAIPSDIRHIKSDGGYDDGQLISSDQMKEIMVASLKELRSTILQDREYRKNDGVFSKESDYTTLGTLMHDLMFEVLNLVKDNCKLVVPQKASLRFSYGDRDFNYEGVEVDSDIY